jgi:hypothetical protein
MDPAQKECDMEALLAAMGASGCSVSLHVNDRWLFDGELWNDVQDHYKVTKYTDPRVEFMFHYSLVSLVRSDKDKVVVYLSL